VLARKTTPTHFFLISSLFLFLLFVFLGLVLFYLGRNSFDSSTPSTKTVDPLVEGISLPEQKPTETYTSENGFSFRYSLPAKLDTSKDADPLSLERVTVAFLEEDQPETGFYGYSVDFSVETKSGSLSTFADQDSLKATDGERQFFTVTNLAGKTAYKVQIDAETAYISYYLPLPDQKQVLVITTALSGPGAQGYEKAVAEILGSVELLD
jgi:hypothetical protein